MIDTNFLDSFDSLLSKVRYSQIDRLMHKMRGYQKLRKKNMAFYHVKFENVKIHDSDLFTRLNKIGTNFNIDEAGVKAIDEASEKIFTNQNPCLNRIKNLVTTEKADEGDVYCTYDVKP